MCAGEDIAPVAEAVLRARLRANHADVRIGETSEARPGMPG